MVTMNLLPWRGYERAYQAWVMKKLFIFSITTALLVNMLLYFLVTHKETKMREIVAALKEQVTHYAVIQAGEKTPGGSIMLEEDWSRWLVARRKTADLFVELGKRSEVSVCFNEIRRSKEAMVFIGHAASATQLTDYLRLWQPARLFSEIKLEQLQYLSASQQLQFRFRGELLPHSV